MSVVLKAEKRENLGSSQTNKIRKQGLVPAVIYAKGGNINLSLNAKDFEKEYLKGTSLSSVLHLDLDGKKTKVIAHKVEVDPVTDRPLHIDFFSCEGDQTVRAKPKLIFVNKEKSPGLKKGGFLHVVLRKVEVFCDVKKDIPTTLEIDIGALHLGSKIRASSITLPSGLSFVKKDNFLIGSIIGRGKSEEEQPGAASGGASGGSAPAEGAPAAKAAAKTAAKPEGDKK